MSTIKEVVDKYGYGCEVGWRSCSNTIYYDRVIKSPLPNFSYRLVPACGSGPYTDFHDDSTFDVWYVRGGDKVKTNEEKLDREDFDIIDKMTSRVLNQLKNEIKEEFLDYLENDLPEMINEIIRGKIKIAGNEEKAEKIANLALICQDLLSIGIIIDDFTQK